MNLTQQRRTKLALTLGPASLPTVRELIVAGMDVARVNLATGTPEEHKEMVHAVRSAAHSARRSVAVMLELAADAVAADVAAALELRPDLLCRPLSSAAEVAGLREGVAADGPPLVARLLTQAAIDAIDEVAATADGVLLDAADAAALARARQGRAFIMVGGGLLAGMSDADQPTAQETMAVMRAASAMPDALLLGAATETGAHPAAAARALADIVAATEAPPAPAATRPASEQSSLIASAVGLAQMDPTDSAIWCFTRTGATARLLSASGDGVPVVAFTLSPIVARRLAVLRGVLPVLLPGTGAGEPLIKRMHAALTAQAGGTGASRIVFITTSDRPDGINRIEVHHL